MNTNAAELYKRIESNPSFTKMLFRRALQDPQGALDAICQLGEEINLPVTSAEVKEYLASLEDSDTKQWLVKARGGL